MTTATNHAIMPLHLSGNTTEQQCRLLKELLGNAVHDACLTAMGQLDIERAQAVLEADSSLKSEVTEAVTELIQRHTGTNRYKEEEVGSNCPYPPTYRVLPMAAQATVLKNLFPRLQGCHEKLARRDPPQGAEEWFAIPRWQALASSYNEAVEMVIGVLASKRRFSNRIADRMGEKYLRQTERTKLAETILGEQQQGNDILVVAAQAGMLHRGYSARRTRVVMASNEFGLGAFAVACLLLAHPDRLSNGETLMIDCCGDEYSTRGDFTFDRIPLFDYDLSGTEFSVFYNDRARNQWGSPTGFLYKTV